MKYACSTIEPFIGYRDSQIHAYNPKDLVEKDLTYQARAENFFAYIYKISRYSYKRYIGNNHIQAQKWYQGNQDLEIKTESQSIKFESRGELIGIYTSLLHLIDV